MKIWIEIVSAAAAVQLLAASLSFVAPSASAAETSACTTGVIVSKAGPVCGTVVTTESGKQAKAFLGIPFGESTAGEKRWKPPVPKHRWTETFVAVQYGPMCPQTVEPPPPPSSVVSQDRRARVPKVRAAGQPSVQQPSQSEDCLSLNIWVPAGATPGARLPVMVFIYGGAFVAGTSSDPLYDGAYLAANRNVILVSFNYRLGVLGFLAADGLSGNYGFLDQQLALTWVHNNIRAFGGDPGKVTIFGESAGAMSVGLHLFSAPGSARLFRAGIMESNFLSIPYKRLADQVNVGNVFKRGLNCPDVKCLRKIDVNELLHAQNAFTPAISTVFSGAKYYLPFAPVIDGAVLTRQPIVGGAEGATRKPMLIGTNKNDALIFVEGQSTSPAGYSAWAASLFGTAFQKVVAKYPARENSSNTALWARVETDDFLLCSTRYLSARVKGRAYVYRFDHQPSFKVWGGAECRQDGNVCHGDELPFVFHTADKIGGGFTAEEAKLSDQIMDYWTNFATDLDPNGRSATKAASRWPRFSAPAKGYLMLNTPAVSVQPDPFRETCKFWDGIGYNLTEPWAPRHDPTP
jgi:carboxylesterase type B